MGKKKENETYFILDWDTMEMHEEGTVEQAENKLSYILKEKPNIDKEELLVFKLSDRLDYEYKKLKLLV